jgi:putative FmdB family regulatory protein
MPTYEYECKQCKRRFEYFQRVSEKPKRTCEKCGGELVRLVSGGAGLIFKGSGFYATDYKKKSEDKEGKKEKKPEKGEGKPEAKSEGSSSAEAPKKSAAGGGE